MRPHQIPEADLILRRHDVDGHLGKNHHGFPAPTIASRHSYQDAERKFSIPGNLLSGRNKAQCTNPPWAPDGHDGAEQSTCGIFPFLTKRTPEMLELVDVHKTYRLGPVEVEVLTGVRLKVAAGGLLSIMGPSGSGKSTLMHILGLLGHPTRGSYLLNGREVSTMNDRELSTFRNAHIGFVFQAFNLLGRMTALENVAIPLVYRGLGQREFRTRARAILEKVGMGDRLNHKPDQLSGGQKQRVAIARALVGEPTVVLADEPTGALDSVTADEVMRLLIRLNHEERITIVIITHDPAISLQCTRRALIRDGVLLEDGARP